MGKNRITIFLIVLFAAFILFFDTGQAGLFDKVKEKVKNTGSQITNKIKNTGRKVKEKVEVTAGWDRYINGWGSKEVPDTLRWTAIRTPYKKHKRDMGNFWDIPGDGDQVEGPGKRLILWELSHKFQRWPQNDRRYKFFPLEQFTGKSEDKGFYLIQCGTGYFVREMGGRVETNLSMEIYNDYKYHWKIENRGKNRFLFIQRHSRRYITARGDARRNGSELITMPVPEGNSQWEFIIVNNPNEKKSTKQIIAKRARETRQIASREVSRLSNIVREKGFKFRIGDTSVITKKIREITGFVNRGLKSDPKWKQISANLPSDVNRNPDMTAFNWRDHGKMTKVKWQGSCGSCWAFGAAGVYEAVYKIKNNVALDLSEQYFIDCLRTERRDCGSCNGGAAITVFEALKKHSALPESIVPYQAKNMQCSSSDSGFNYRVKDTGWINTRQNYRIIKELICKFGPVAGYVFATDLFKGYRGGVYDEHPKIGDPSKVNHVIIIVGWDDTKKAFLIKNSWGDWGEKGYMWIEYGSNNIGNGACWIKI